MPMKKPSEFGDTYFCYKKFTAIIVLACVDARGIFTYVNAGRPGSVGDSYTYRHSIMIRKIASGEWLAHSPRTIAGVIDRQAIYCCRLCFPPCINMHEML